MQNVTRKNDDKHASGLFVKPLERIMKTLITTDGHELNLLKVWYSIEVRTLKNRY